MTIQADDEWYWPQAARGLEHLPVFWVRDTLSSHGRYAREPKKITGIDLVRFHGHACDGLFRGMYALSVVFPLLFPSGVIDRTDLRVISRNSPCLGDVASYLTGARIRFGTQDVDSSTGVWFIVQRISSMVAVRVEEAPGFYPSALLQLEASLGSLSGADLADAVSRLQDAQNHWINNVLLPSSPADHYRAQEIPLQWSEVPYAHKGARSDILFKNVPEVSAQD